MIENTIAAWHKLMETKDADGRITEFNVMIRPLKAINLIHKIMRLEFQKHSETR